MRPQTLERMPAHAGERESADLLDRRARALESAEARLDHLEEIVEQGLLALDQPAGRRCRLLAAAEETAFKTDCYLSPRRKFAADIAPAMVQEIEEKGQELRTLAADLIESLGPDLRRDPQLRCYLRCCRSKGDRDLKKEVLSPAGMPAPADEPGASIEVETHSACVMRATVLALLGLFGCSVGAFFIEAVQYRPWELGELAIFPPILLGLCFTACFRAMQGSYLALRTVSLEFRGRELFRVRRLGSWRREQRLSLSGISAVWSTDEWWPMRLLRWLLPSQAPASRPYITLRQSNGRLLRLEVGGLGAGGSSEQVASRFRRYLGIGPETETCAPSATVP